MALAARRAAAAERAMAVPPPWPAWLNHHQAFLDYLRQEGFVIGLYREIRLVQTLDMLRRDGIALDDEAATRWLGPLLCSAPQDQGRLPGVIARYAARFATQAPRAGVAGFAADLAASPISMPRGGRRLRWILAVALAVPAAAIIAAVVSFLGPGAGGPADGPVVAPTPADPAGTGFLALLGQVALALAPGLLAVLFVLWRHGRELAISRNRQSDEGDDERLALGRAIRAFLPPVRFRRIARMFGAHRSVPSRRVAVRGTVAATVRAAGRPVIRFGRRPALPEHILAAERTSASDHVGALADIVAERLEANDVAVIRYDFDQDLRRLRNHRSGRYETLSDVAARHHGHRFLLISDGARLLNAEGDTWRWFAPAIEGFDPAVLLTPAPTAVWGARERTLAQAGIVLCPLTPDGIEILAAQLAHGVAPPSFAASTAPRNDALAQLERKAEHWLSDQPPEPDEIEDLVLHLRMWLGENGLLVLAGTALFPEIRSDVTLALAEALEPREGEAIVTAERLAEIARTPWMRHGRMPDWLRVALLDALPSAAAERLRQAYERVLATAAPAEAGGFGLARRRDAVLLGLRALFGPVEEEDRVERITWDFRRGRKLELAVPSAWQQLLRPRFDRVELAALVAGGLLSAALALFGDALVDLAIRTFRWAQASLVPSILAATLAAAAVALKQLQDRLPRITPSAPGSFAFAAFAIALATAGGEPALIGPSALLAAGAAAWWTLYAGTTAADPNAALPVATNPWLMVGGFVAWATCVPALYGEPPHTVPLVEVLHGGALAAILATLRRQLGLTWPDIGGLVGLAIAARQLAVLFDADGSATAIWPFGIMSFDARLGPAPYEAVVLLTALLRSKVTTTGLRARSAIALSALWVGSINVPNLDPDGHLLLQFMLPVVLILVSTASSLAPRSLIRLALGVGLMFVLGAAAAIVVALPISVIDNAIRLSALGLTDEMAFAIVLSAPAGIVWLLARGVVAPRVTLFDSTMQNPTAWAWVPVLFLLLGFGYALGPFSLRFAGLWLPVAAWLGWHYGAAGTRLVILGGLPLLLGLDYQGFQTANWIGLYVAAIVVCRLTADADYRGACLSADSVTSRMLVLLFVALGCDIGIGRNLSGMWLSASTSLAPYLWMLLIVIGMSGARLRAPLIWLAIAAVGGTALSYLPPQRFGDIAIAYHIAGPQDMVTGAVALLLGRLLRAALGAPVTLFRLGGGELTLGPGPTQIEIRAGISVLPEVKVPVPASIARLFQAPLLAALALSIAGSMFAWRPNASAFGPSELALSLSTSYATAMLLFACGLVGRWQGAAIAGGMWLFGGLLLPLALVGGLDGGSDALRLGPVQIMSPPRLIGGSFAIAPGMSLAVLEPVFAVFGWWVGRTLAARGDRGFAASPTGAIPPPFRFRYMDVVWALAAGALLAALLVNTAMRVIQPVLDGTLYSPRPLEQQRQDDLQQRQNQQQQQVPSPAPNPPANLKAN